MPLMKGDAPANPTPLTEREVLDAVIAALEAELASGGRVPITPDQIRAMLDRT